jgi:hypothetical protein
MTEADLLKCTMREEAHFNGGKEWFGYRFRSVQHPRLSRFDKYIRATRGVESTFEVDGEPVASLQAAAELLVKPYEVQPEDIKLLNLVPDCWELLDQRARFLRLRDVGLVEFRDGSCRRTDSGRAALHAPNAGAS